MKTHRIRVLIFISEILSAKSLIPIAGQIVRDPDFEVTFINDGFCVEFVQSLGLPVEYILSDFESRIDSEIRDSALVLMGKSYVQRSEYTILRRAAHWGVPVLMVLPDMGFDIVRAKLKGIGGPSSNAVPYPKLLIADESTRNSLKSLDIPEDRIVEFGNPYFDQHYQDTKRFGLSENPIGIGYFSTPFDLDFERGILPANYRQTDFISDIQAVSKRLGQRLIGKRHPQVDPSLFQGIHLFEGTPLAMIWGIRVAIGSYSTTLLEAYSAGIPAISYQPWSANIRSDVFAGRVPIVKTPAELEQAIRVAMIVPRKHVEPKHITYNPGKSLAVAERLVRDELRVLR